MKVITFLVLAFAITLIAPSCKKNGDEIKSEDVARANEFKAFISAKKFQIKEYYSDKPIDYEEDDEVVKSETNLWPYVSLWLHDDFNVFDAGTGKVTITQNTHKMEGISDEVFTRDFSTGADKDGAFFKFLNYQYNPLTYRIVEFTGDHFIVYVDWHSGAKVFTKFQVIP